MNRKGYSELLPMDETVLSGPNGTWRIRYISAREWPEGLHYHFRLERQAGGPEREQDVWILVSRPRLEREAGQVCRPYLKSIAERIRRSVRTGETELDCREPGRELAARV